MWHLEALFLGSVVASPLVGSRNSQGVSVEQPQRLKHSVFLREKCK